MKQSFALSLLLVTGLFTHCGSMTSAADLKRPNVLFISADDLGLQLGCYGETAIETP